jgi:uncharacterized membrane protein required for colicin V production
MVASVISYALFFVIIAVALWVLAGTAEPRLNLPPSSLIYRWGGMMFGFLKGVVVIWGFIFLISQIPMTDDSLQVLHSSPAVHAIQSITMTVDTTLGTCGSQRAYHTLHPLIAKSIF